MFRFILILLFSCFFPTASFTQPAGTWQGHSEYLMEDSSGSKTRLKLNRSYVMQIDTDGGVSGTSRIYYTHSKSANPFNSQQNFMGRYNAATGKIAIVFEAQKLVESPSHKKADSVYYSCSLTQIGDSLAMTLQADNKQAVDFKYLDGAQSWHIGPLPIIMHVSYIKPVALPSLTFKEPDPLPVRDREIQHIIVLDTSFIKIDLYDNGEIDNDIVTLQLDGKTIVRSKRLSVQPVSLWLELNKEPVEHLLEMFADNLGSIPPNTALLVLTCKKKRYELNLSSNEKVNGSVKLIVRP